MVKVCFFHSNECDQGEMSDGFRKMVLNWMAGEKTHLHQGTSGQSYLGQLGKQSWLYLIWLVAVGITWYSKWCPRVLWHFFFLVRWGTKYHLKMCPYDGMLSPFWFQGRIRLVCIQEPWHQVAAGREAWLEQAVNVIKRWIRLPVTHWGRNWHSCYFIFFLKLLHFVNVN